MSSTCQTVKSCCLDLALYFYAQPLVKSVVDAAVVYYVDNYTEEQKVSLTAESTGDSELDDLLADLDDM